MQGLKLGGVYESVCVLQRGATEWNLPTWIVCFEEMKLGLTNTGRHVAVVSGSCHLRAVEESIRRVCVDGAIFR